ncbi:MAG TPA: carboxypeptidase regulatory-like domain-containing protein [Bryobacteraceae bacterium]|nr:carboxypeptidase regulatory-like domain-containing protein [Bryobacteraceae bacterium]
MSHIKQRRAAALALSMSLWGAIAYGQTITGRIVGTVSDSTPAAVPEAAVTITNQETGVVWHMKTDSHGGYVAPSLPAGTYRVQVERQGFRASASTGNVVNVAEETRVDVSLQVGSVSETVEVTATAPLVRSTTSEMGEIIDHKQVDELPLNGRLFSQLMQLIPGAVPDGPTDAAESVSGSGARSPIQADINGISYKNGNFTIDGVSNREPANGYINISPPVEAIQEFKVQTNNPSAEFGSFGGAIVNLTIRSGTNAVHGFLFEYFRNDALNARTFFAATIPPLKSNQFGGGVGGPIRKNKIFYFGDYQGLRLRYGSVQRYTVPTDLMKQGILSPADGFKNVAYDPLSGNSTPFPNNIISANRIDKASKGVAALYPEPNVLSVAPNATTGPGIDYQQNTVQLNDPDQVDLKLDYNVSDRTHMFARETYNARTYRNPPPGNMFMQGSEDADSSNHNAVIGHTFAARANLLNELRLGFNRFSTFHFAADYGIDENNILGIPNGNLPGHPETSGIARFNGIGANYTGGTGSTNAWRLTDQYQITEALTWIKASHTLKFGADLVRDDTTVTNPDSPGPGQFNFDGNFTTGLTAAGKSIGGTGVPWASFLLGYPASVGRDLVNTFPDVRRYMNGLYAQDDWRATSSLTLNIGLRYELFTLACEHFDRQTNLNLSTGVLDLARGGNCAPNQNLFTKGLAPRLGVAWSPDSGKTALRSAFGISYSNNVFGANSGTLERNYPYFQLFSINNPGSQYTPFWQVSVNGLPTPILPSPGTTSIPVPANIAPYYMPAGFRPDEVVMWNFGVQRQITHTSLLDVTYVGTRGSHLFRSENIDTPFPAPGSQQANRPYNYLIPQISTINYRGSNGDSHYNGLQAKFTKRSNNGLFMLLSYTFSKSIDDVNNVFWVYNDALNRGLSPFHRLHNFVGSYGYALPFGPGRPWLSHTGRLVEYLTGGWQLNGIAMLRTGDPLAVNVQTSQLNTGTANRAFVTCPHVNTIGEINKWFDTSCFANPPAYVFGTANTGTVFGPGFVNFDLSIFKAERIRERDQFQIRFEAFNAMNAHHFSDPNTTFGSSTFGQITNTSFPARELQIGLKYSF